MAQTDVLRLAVEAPLGGDRRTGLRDGRSVENGAVQQQEECKSLDHGKTNALAGKWCHAGGLDSSPSGFAVSGGVPGHGNLAGPNSVSNSRRSATSRSDIVAAMPRSARLVTP